MIYFSEIVNKKVQTEDGIYIGKLKDLVFAAQEIPVVTKFLIKKDKSFLLPIKVLKYFNGKVVVQRDYNVVLLEENELYINKNLLDKQIIDLEGSKVVRVNDVLINNTKSTWTVSGVDTSLSSILRWFNIEGIFLKMWRLLSLPENGEILAFDDIQPLELSRGKLQLKLELGKLKKIRPEDLADYLEQTNVNNTKKILTSIDEEYAAEVVNSLNVTYQTEIFKTINPQKAARIIALVDPDEAVDILMGLDALQVEAILNLLPDSKKAPLEHLLKHVRTPVGDLMTTEFITAKANDLTKNIIDKIKNETVEFKQLNNIYVLNETSQLIGVCNLHELLLQNPETPIYKYMISDVVVAHLHTPQELTIKRMLKYKLSTLPVVNSEKVFLGIITLDDVAEIILSNLKS